MSRLISAVLNGAILTTLLSQASLAQTVAITHCRDECPRYGSALIANNSKVVVHHLYAAGLNNFSRRADWVAYRLTPEAVGVASLLPREWQPDRLAGFSDISRLTDLAELEPEASLPQVSNATSAYGAGATPVVEEQNRVRLAPLTSFAKAPYWAELNNLSNMLPMPAPLRLGPWLRLEQSLNSLVRRENQIHVVTGPVYYQGQAPGSETLKPGENLAAYFKIVSTDKATAAFLFPHDLPQHESFCGRAVPVAEIERLTGLTLLSRQPVSTDWQLLAELGCPQPTGP